MANQVIIVPAADAEATSSTLALPAATSTEVIAANPLRNTVIISTEADVWLYYGAGPAVVGEGLCVREAADPWVESEWKGAIYAICAAATALGIIETEIGITSEADLDAGYAPSGPSDNYFERAVPAAGWGPATPFPPQA